MSLKDKITTREIDGLTVRMSPLPARFVNQWLVRLGGYISPLLGLVAGAVPDPTKVGGFKLEEAEISDLKLNQLGTAAQAVFSQLKPGEVDALFDAMLSRTTVEVDGNVLDVVGQAAFDEVFTGRAATSWKVLGMALVENYRDFFGGALGALIAQGKAAVAKAVAKAASKEAAKAVSASG